MTKAAALLAAEESNEAPRAWNKGSETRVHGANKSPQYPKQNQTQRSIAKVGVPLH